MISVFFYVHLRENFGRSKEFIKAIETLGLLSVLCSELGYYKIIKTIMKKVLIINGNPNPTSFCKAIAEQYQISSAEKGNSVKILHVGELKFELNLKHGFEYQSEFENDLLLSQNYISWAEHIVIIHPVWWGSVPAVLKGFFDRVLLPGFAFKYHENDPMWDKLLKEKTGHLIYTSDTPSFIYKWIFGAPSENMVKKRVMKFCGISPVKVTHFGSMRKKSASQREKILKQIKNIA